MADRTVSSLPAATAIADSDLFYVVQGGNSRKATAAQLKGSTSLSSLADVSVASPSAGDVLTWDNTGGEWVAAPAPGGGGGGSVPNGGVAGEVLTKQSGVDQDVAWSNPLGALATYTLSAASSLEIEAFAGLSNRSKVVIEVEYLTFSADSTGLTMQFKLNGSYKTSGYKWNRFQLFTATTASNGGSASDSSIGLVLSGAGGPGNASGEGTSGTINLLNPYDTSGWKRAVFDFTHIDDQAAQRLVQSRGAGTYGSTDAANELQGIRLAPTTGTMSGKIRVYAPVN